MYTPGQFDDAVFDGSFFDTVGQNALSEKNIIEEYFDSDFFADSEEVELIKITDVLDTEGQIISTTEVSDTDVYIKILKNLNEIRTITGRGESIEGQAVAICYPYYEDLTNNGTTTIEINDKIKRLNFSDKIYTVENITSKTAVSGVEIYRVLYLRADDA